MFRYDCPLRLRAPWCDATIRLYSMLVTHNTLPDRGGVLDQSAWIIDAFEVIRGVVAELSKPAKETRHGRRRP